MADKFEAAFHGLSEGAMQEIVDGLHKAIQRDTRRQKVKVVVKSLATTLCVTGFFTVLLVFLGWWGYIPAILGTTTYFTVRDLVRLSN